jgi:hypothetical protein
MSGLTAKDHIAASARFIFYCLLPLAFFLAVGAIILFTLYINAPQAAGKISTVLSEKLDLPVTIAEINLHGDTLTIKGLTVGNPPEFTGNSLVTVAATTVAPDWMGIITGKRSLRLLEVDEARIDILRGNNGVWNFEKLRKRFSGGKGGSELFIGDLRINNGDILVNGTGLRGVSLKLRNVASKGSAGAQADLAFDDQSGNRYGVTGSFRAGASPEADFSLEAPSLALAGLAVKGGRIAVTGGKGALRIKAALHEGVVRSSIAATFTGATLRINEGGEIPLTGGIQGSATYDLKHDLFELEHAALVLDKILEMHTTGSIADLKRGLRYDLAIGIRNLDIAHGAGLLPAMRKAGMKVTGTVSAEKIRLTGSVKHGVASIDGSISLKGLMLSRNNMLMVSGIGTDMKIAAANHTIRIFGELLQKPADGTPLIETIRAPYKLTLTNRLKPIAIDLDGFSARLMGVPLTGNFRIRPEDRSPLALSLQIPENSLKAMSYGDAAIAGGTAGMSLELKGSGIADFNGNVSLILDKLNGSIKGERYLLGRSTLKAGFSRASGHYSASGDFACDSSSFKGVTAEVRSGFNATDGRLHLENGTLRIAGATVNYSRVTTVLPGKSAQPAQQGYPLDVKLTGGAVSRGDLALTGISANLRGNYAGVNGAKRFDGIGEIAAEKLLRSGRNIGAPRANISMSRSGVNISLAGAVLGGALAGALDFNPDAVADGVRFDLTLKGAELAQLARISGEKEKVTLPAGQLLVTARGNYTRKDGVTCRIRGEGDGITIASAGGKGLLANAGVKFDAGLAGGNITLTDALFHMGEGATVLMQGAVTGALSPQREGRIAYRLSRAPLARIVDPLANSLPRFLQEASVSGDIAAEGAIAFSNGRTTLQGSLQLVDAGIDAGSGKLKIAAVSGNIPYSLGFPARHAASPELSVVLKRESYPQQLALFSRATGKGSLLKIGRIAYGPLDFGDTALRIRADEGIIEALSFTSTLTTGKILGSGYVAFTNGGSYGGDLLLNNLSLLQICALFPNIKGYVSGRMDGIAMFEGRGFKSGGLNGYTYVWTRPGDGEKMHVSKEFLQKLAGKKLQGFLFRNDRSFDKGEVKASLESGYLTFEILDIANTNFFGVRDLKVTVTETQNRIALDHLLNSISQAVSRGKGGAGKESPAGAAPAPEFKWNE